MGRYRYRVAPQGYVASGDAYNARYDEIISEVERKTKCVDDAMIWDDDDDLEEHWWRTLDYLTLVGENGIILTLKKLQFSQKVVNFAGFVVGETTVKPLPKYLDAIKNFQRPSTISEARSWFGLVNQVSRYGKLAEIMYPFKELLSPKSKFRWTEEMEAAFERSKLSIISAIEEGVEAFDPKRTTLLGPDFSKKHFSLLGTAEIYIFKLTTIHWSESWEVKHLMDDIDNSMLVSFIQRIRPWQFNIKCLPSRSIPGPDTTSRRPNEKSEHVVEDKLDR